MKERIGLLGNTLRVQVKGRMVAMMARFYASARALREPPIARMFESWEYSIVSLAFRRTAGERANADRANSQRLQVRERVIRTKVVHQVQVKGRILARQVLEIEEKSGKWRFPRQMLAAFIQVPWIRSFTCTQIS